MLASGLDQVYPERNRALAEQIVASGALVSEFPIGTRPVPQLFPVRNRLINSIMTKLLPLGDDVGFICGHGAGSSIGQERMTNPFITGEM